MSTVLRRVIRLGTSLPPASPGRVLPRVLQYDAVAGGGYKISGTAVVDATPDVPVRRRVRLYDAQTGALLRETWSDATTGQYAFERLRMSTYFVVSHDHTGEYNAVVRDRITPVPM